MSMDNGTYSIQKAGDRGGYSRRRGKSLANILWVLVLILIAIGLLLPLFNRPHPPYYETKQRAQLSSIGTAIELFNSEFDMYPPSGAVDEAGVDYCGAMKLCEAVMGRDLLGFHPDSFFRSRGTDADGRVLYPAANVLSTEEYKVSLSKRKGPYLPLDNANAYRLVDLYGGHMDETGLLHRLPDMARIRRDMWSVPIDDEETRETIARAWRTHQVMLEPHGAVGWAALNRFFEAGGAEPDALAVSLETAHPAKFMDIVKDVLAVEMKIPPQLSTALEKEKQAIKIAKEFEFFKSYILDTF